MGWVPKAYRKELATTQQADVLRWVIIHGVQPQVPCPLTSPLETEHWDQLLQLCAGQRVLGLLQSAVRAGLPVTAGQEASLDVCARRNAIDQLHLAQVLQQVGTALTDAGIEWLLLKGLATAHVLYPRPGLRTTGDIDLVVHPGQYEQAQAALWGAGLIAYDYPTHGPASARHVRGHVLVHTDGEVEIDVHRSVEGAFPWHRIPLDVVFRAPHDIGAGTFAPDPTVLVLHALLHLAQGRPGPVSLARLSTLADLVWARALHPEHHRAALALAESTGCAVPARWADAVVRSWDHHDAPQPLPVRVRVFDAALRVRGLPEICLRLSGPERVRRMIEALAPSEEYRDHEERSTLQQLGYIAQRFRRSGS